MNPCDLSTIPADFYQSPMYVNSQTLKDPAELAHLRTIVAAFLNYENDCQIALNRMENAFNKLNDKQKSLLMITPKERVEKVRQAIQQNQNFLTACVIEWMCLFPDDSVHKFSVPQHYADKARSVLVQAKREWSEEGKLERDQCFTPIIQKLKELYAKPEGVKVLIPGCGLGRLPYEIATCGFSAQGNEFAYEMLFAGQTIMNECTDGKKFLVYSKPLQFNNLFKFEDIMTPVEVPEISEFISADLSVASGEFLESYSDDYNIWDCVVTCFFLDTAHNPLDYLERIRDMLKPNGYWIHFGPLQYHYSDVESEWSVELSWQELEYAAQKMGFLFESQEIKQSSYGSSSKSMVNVTFNSVFSVARKTESKGK